MTKLGKIFALSILVAIVSGCAGMADSMSKLSGLGVIKEDKNTFDGSTTISVSPSFLYNPENRWGNSYKLGARWNSAEKEYVALIMSYDSNVSSGSTAYVNLTGLDVNIGGEKLSFDTHGLTDLDSSDYNTVSGTIYTKSENSVVIPLALLRQMVAAEDCRIRIHSSKGYEDAIFSTERIPGGQGTALLSIREFIQKIDSFGKNG